MKKNVLNLLAVSMIALLAGGLKAGKCSVADNAKKVKLVNDAGQDVRFIVMRGESPSTAGTLVIAGEVVVSVNETKQIPYCSIGGTIVDIIAVGPLDVAPGNPGVKVVTRGTIQGDGSYSAKYYGDVAGGVKLNFSNLFNQLRTTSGTVTITVSPTTAGGLIAKGQIK